MNEPIKNLKSGPFDPKKDIVNKKILHSNMIKTAIIHKQDDGSFYDRNTGKVFIEITNKSNNSPLKLEELYKSYQESDNSNFKIKQLNQTIKFYKKKYEALKRLNILFLTIVIFTIIYFYTKI